MLHKITIVLVNPSHPGNIGAVARAMKNMGLQNLALVQPKLFPHHEATARAAGADDLLSAAKVYSDLDQALQHCQQVYALSARERRLEWPNYYPKACAEKIVNQAKDNIEVALVLGRENSGLTNDELAKCHYHVIIPSNPVFPSLNLAAAVQVIAYELWQQASGHERTASNPMFTGVENDTLKSEDKKIMSRQLLVTGQQMQGFFEHLERTLFQLKVLSPEHPKLLMKRLRRLFNRAELDVVELNILRGILTAINKNLSS